MKNISTILSILALALIAVLFYLHFAQSGKQSKNPVTAEKKEQNQFKVAYFDIDSLQEHYEYFKDVSGDIKKKENSMNAELNDLTAKYQRTIRKWQEKGNSITQAEGEAAFCDGGCDRGQSPLVIGLFLRRYGHRSRRERGFCPRWPFGAGCPVF